MSLKVVKLPVPDTFEAKEVLESALKANLSNVIVLSQNEDGSIYHNASDSLTCAEVNWIIDGYKRWLMDAAGRE